MESTQINNTTTSTTRGHVSVFFGPMFSGKSTSLLNKINKYEKLGKKVLVINYAHDTRYSDDASLVTHAKQSHKANKCFELKEVDDVYMDYDVIAIDEGQFFHDCAEKCDEYANAGKKVFVAALDATFQRKSFNNITNIIPIAEKVVKLRAKCNKCQGMASYSARKIVSSQIELIGGEDIYEPLCRTCFMAKEELAAATAAAEAEALALKNSSEEEEFNNENSLDSVDSINATPTKKAKQDGSVEGNESTCSTSILSEMVVAV